MNLSAAAAQANPDFNTVGVKDETDRAGHRPTPRSRLRASASGSLVKAPVLTRERRHVRGSGSTTARSSLSAGPPRPRPPA